MIILRFQESQKQVWTRFSLLAMGYLTLVLDQIPVIWELEEQMKNCDKEETNLVQNWGNSIGQKNKFLQQ